MFVCVFACSTNGLVNVVRAKNINTVGDISSLTERQIQGLPFKSPKVLTVRNALKSFEKQVMDMVEECSSTCPGRAHVMSMYLTCACMY